MGPQINHKTPTQSVLFIKLWTKIDRTSQSIDVKKTLRSIEWGKAWNKSEREKQKISSSFKFNMMHRQENTTMQQFKCLVSHYNFVSQSLSHYVLTWHGYGRCIINEDIIYKSITCFNHFSYCI